MVKTNKTQKGGLLLGVNDISDIEDFIKLADIQYITNGSFGVIYEATLNEGLLNDAKSKGYKIPNIRSMDFENFNKPITKLLIKITFIHTDIPSNKDIDIEIDGRKLKSTHLDTFTKEVNVQTEILHKSFQYMQPLCPTILSASYIKPTKEGIIELLSSKDKYLKGLFDAIISMKNIVEYVGIIAMEYADDYEMLMNYVYDTKKSLTKCTNDECKKIYNEYLNIMLMVFYVLIKLAELGYSHGDFHIANILYNKNYNTFIRGIKGRPILIDFGLVTKLSPTDHKKVMDYSRNKKYTWLLRYIYNEIPRGDGVSLTDITQLYGYVAGYYDLLTDNDIPKQYQYLPFVNGTNVNNLLIEMFKNRELQIDNNISTFNSKSKEERNGMLLPLNVSFIAKIFRGLFPLDTKTNNNYNSNRNYSNNNYSNNNYSNRNNSNPKKTKKSIKHNNNNIKSVFQSELPLAY